MASISIQGGTRGDLFEDGEPAPLPPAAGVGTKPTLRRDLVAVDLVALLLAWGWLPLAVSPPDRTQAALVAAVAVGVTVLLIASQRLYLARVCAVRSLEIVRLGRCTVVVVVAAIVVGELGLAPAMTVGACGRARAPRSCCWSSVAPCSARGCG